MFCNMIKQKKTKQNEKSELRVINFSKICDPANSMYVYAASVSSSNHLKTILSSVLVRAGSDISLTDITDHACICHQ